MDGPTIQNDERFHMIARTERRRRAARLWGSLALLLLLFGTALVPFGSSPSANAPRSPDEETSTSAAERSVHPPGLGLGPAAAVPHPAYYTVWYTQVGATLAQFNNSGTQSGVKSISVDIPLVSSPYPIGYELNGLTNKGDWFQAVIGVNWEGCPGLDLITEVWNNQQGSGPVGCSTSMTLNYGDTIRLGLNFSSGIGVCMDFADVTRGETANVCQSEPDSGASAWVSLGGTSNGNGYFTGPMTEIANTTPTSCPDYTHMPVVNYEWKAAFGLSEYVPWSDEFELGAGQCYSNSGGGVTFASNDPSTNYFDTAEGNGYGPHYVAGQLYSFVDASYGFRIQTDPVPLTGVTLAADVTTIPISANVTLTAAVTGGASPYTALWALNGTLFANGSLSRAWTGTHGGAYRFTAYGVDKHLDVVGPSPVVTILVNGPLSVSGISASLPTGNADVDQTMVFGVTVSGGIPAYSFDWTGLPPTCPTVNAAVLSCTPESPGNYTVEVAVTDSNHSLVEAGARNFTVSAQPVPNLLASVTRLDIGQTIAFATTVQGGAGSLSYDWAGLPTGCVAVDGPIVSCTARIAAISTVSVSVTDANDDTVTTSALAVQVFPTPTVSLSVNRAVADAGVAMTFTATPVGGSGGFTITWTGLPIGCTAAEVLLLVCTPTTGGTYPVSVNLTDSVGGTASSGPIVVFAYAPLNLTVAGPSTVAVGGLLSASVNVSGGAPGIDYQWSGLPEGCNPPDSALLSCEPAIAGDYNITVTVSDGGGGVSSVTYHLAVVHPTSSTAGSSPEFPLWLLAGLLLAIVVAVAAISAVRLRKRR
jgi:hypothetical protein